MCISQPTFASDVTGDFVDLSEDHWAFSSIEMLKDMQVLDGYADGTFRPDDYITREAFATVLSKAFSLQMKGSTLPSFSDVPPNRWSYDEIEAAKDYLTGYYPYGGKPFFQPEIYTTREDVTVALCRALNISPESVEKTTFIDDQDISPNLVAYIESARNNRLIGGYPDGSFKPQAPITRAEIASLIHKALKSANVSEVFKFDVSIPETTEYKYLIITGTTHPDATLTINGKIKATDEGTFSTIYELDMGEGGYPFDILATMPDGRKKYHSQTVTYQLPETYFKILCDQTVNDDYTTISGNITDYNFDYQVFINREKVSINSSGHWSKGVSLKLGGNKFDCLMIDPYNEHIVKTKTIVFEPSHPEIIIDHLPDQTHYSEHDFFGRVEDSSDDYPTLYVDGERVNIAGGNFKFTRDLEQGTNTFTLQAFNKFGMDDKKTITINYEPKAVTLENLLVPSKVDRSLYYLNFEVISESGEEFTTYLNGKYLNSRMTEYSGQTLTRPYQKELKLNNGSNEYTLEVKSDNDTIIRTFELVYEPDKPSIELSAIVENDGDYMYSFQVKTTSKTFVAFDGAYVKNYSHLVLDEEYSIYYYTVQSNDDNHEIKATDAIGQETILSF